MEPLREYEANCGFSVDKPRFGSIKVKIPKMQPFIAKKEEDQVEEEEEETKLMGLEEEEEEDHDGGMSMDLVEEKKHICCECGKEFKSGKALGGHKRIHGFEARKFSMVRPKMLYGRSQKGEMEVACCVCHKKFTSMKALYGHMRFHPDRGWKGVLPPPLGNSSSSTLSVDDHDDEFISSDYDDDEEEDDENSELWNNNWEVENVVDLKDSLKGWSVKGKRGRRSVDLIKVDESDPPPEEEQANQLLLLANILENDEKTSYSHTVEVKYQEKRKYKKKKRLSEMEKESSSTHNLVVGGAAEESGIGVLEKHVCVTCNKSFTSYQALGGHRASHNKVKSGENNNLQARANSEANLLLGTEAMITSAQGSNTSLSSGDHICNICHKRFPTGQALGGHKRCHWAGPVSSEASTAAPAAASCSQVTVQEEKNLKRKFLEFDLNELPPNEEEEEEERV